MQQVCISGRDSGEPCDLFIGHLLQNGCGVGEVIVDNQAAADRDMGIEERFAHYVEKGEYDHLPVGLRQF